MMATATPDRKQNFTTEIPSNVSEFNWKIKNLKEAIAMDETLKDLKLNVEAGHTIEPTHWQFFLGIDDEKNLKVNLKLLKYSDQRHTLFAKFDYAINDAKFNGGDIFNYVKFYGSFKLPTSMQFVKEPASLDKLLVDGVLSLRLRITIYKDVQVTLDEPSRSRPNSKMEDFPLPPILEDFNELLESGTNADIKIQTKDGKEFQAHRAILSSRSPVFFAMFQTKMTESLTGVVHIKDLSSEAMAILLKFIYTGKVAETWGNKFEEIINAAEKYSLTLLKEYCDRNLVKICTPKNVWIPLRKAQQFRLKQAEKEISEYIAANIRAILDANKLEH